MTTLPHDPAARIPIGVGRSRLVAAVTPVVSAETSYMAASAAETGQCFEVRRCGWLAVLGCGC